MVEWLYREAYHKWSNKACFFASQIRLEDNFEDELQNQDLDHEAELLKVLVEGDDEIPDWQCNSFHFHV